MLSGVAWGSLLLCFSAVAGLRLLRRLRPLRFIGKRLRNG